MGFCVVAGEFGVIERLVGKEGSVGVRGDFVDGPEKFGE